MNREGVFMLERIINGGRALLGRLASPDSIPEVTDSEAYDAFDHTCRHYLKMPASEFLNRWDRHEIPADTPHLDKVVDLLRLAR
jgi:hypothetical protein